MQQIYAWAYHDRLGTVVIAQKLTEAGTTTPGELRGNRRVRGPGQWA